MKVGRRAGATVAAAGLVAALGTGAPARAGLAVVYPGDATSSGLHAGTALPVGQDDYAAIRLDAAGLATGTYTVPVHATYTGGSFDGQLTLSVT